MDIESTKTLQSSFELNRTLVLYVFIIMNICSFVNGFMEKYETFVRFVG